MDGMDKVNDAEEKVFDEKLDELDIASAEKKEEYVSYEEYLKKVSTILERKYGSAVTKEIVIDFIELVEEKGIEFESEEHVESLFETLGYVEKYVNKSENVKSIDEETSEKDKKEQIESQEVSEYKNLNIEIQNVLKEEYGIEFPDWFCKEAADFAMQNKIKVSSKEQVLSAVDKYFANEKFSIGSIENFVQEKKFALIKEKLSSELNKDISNELALTFFNQLKEDKFSLDFYSETFGSDLVVLFTKYANVSYEQKEKLEKVQTVLEEKYGDLFSEIFYQELVNYMDKNNIEYSINAILMAASTFDFINEYGFIHKKENTKNENEMNGKSQINHLIQDIIFKTYSKKLSEEKLNAFITFTFKHGSRLSSREEVIAEYGKFENAIIFNEDFYENLNTPVAKLDYLRKIIATMENLGQCSDIGKVVPCKRNGKIAQIPEYLVPFYKKYVAMAKNVKQKMVEEIAEITKEEEIERDSFQPNPLASATLQAEEKLERSVFVSAETIEEIYEKICILRKQKNKDQESQKKLKVYESKLRHLTRNKHAMLTMKWKKFWGSSIILSKFKNAKDLIPKLQFLTIFPEKFIKSKEITDEEKESLVSNAMHLFEGISEEEFIKVHKDDLRKLEKLIVKRNKKILKIKTQKHDLDRKKLRKQITKKSKKQILNVIDYTIKYASSYMNLKKYIKSLGFKVSEIRTIELDNEVKRVSYLLENSEHLLMICGNNYGDFQNVVNSLNQLKNVLENEMDKRNESETRGSR